VIARDAKACEANTGTHPQIQQNLA